MNPSRIERVTKAANSRWVDIGIVVENVQDIRNLGAVIRTCEAFGIYHIYALFTNSEFEDLTEIKLGKRSSMGARQWVKVHLYKDRQKCFSALRIKYKNILASILSNDGRLLHDLNFSESFALVFGNESLGITRETLDLCDGSFYIPMMGLSESLNLSNACSISVYEIFRQRLLSPPTITEDMKIERSQIEAEYLYNMQRKNRIMTSKISS